MLNIKNYTVPQSLPQKVEDFIPFTAWAINNLIDNIKLLPKEHDELQAILAETMQYIIALVNAISDNFDLVSYSGEERQKFTMKYIACGRCGWTPFPNQTQRVIFIESENEEALSKNMQEFYSAARVQELFEVVSTQTGKNPDLSSAIFCYRQGEYKACALLLFSLIETLLICRQIKNPRVGHGAVKLLSDAHESLQIEEAFSTFLRHTCLLSCLNTLFAKADGFKNPMGIINRNFLSHGMAERNITKKDCIQLFLVFSNLQNFLKILSDNSYSKQEVIENNMQPLYKFCRLVIGDLPEDLPVSHLLKQQRDLSYSKGIIVTYPLETEIEKVSIEGI